MSTRTKIRYVGFDPGSAFGTMIITTVILEDGNIVEKQEPVELTIPSLIGTTKFDKLVNDRGTGTNETLEKVMRAGEIALGYNRKEYLVGPCAEKDGTNTTSAKGAQKRYTDLHSRLLFFGIYGSLVKDPESTVRLITGVPISLYDRETRIAVKKNLEGSHPFTFNGQNHIVNVTVGTVTREGVKALSLYGKEKGTQGFIDIGERTTDIGQTDGQIPIDRYCKADVFGVGRVIETLISEIKAKHHRILKLSEARAILKAHTDERPLPSVKVGNAPIAEDEIISIIESAKSSEWTAIETFIDSSWNEEGAEVGSNLESILCLGGGAKVWQRDLKTKFSQTIFPQASELFPGKDEGTVGLIANAEAYHNLAFDLEVENPMIWMR